MTYSKRIKKLDFLLFIVIIIFIVALVIIFSTLQKEKHCKTYEGYMVECCDVKGICWMTIHPIDYINATGKETRNYDAFNNSQMCIQHDTDKKHNYVFCYEEKNKKSIMTITEK